MLELVEVEEQECRHDVMPCALVLALLPMVVVVVSHVLQSHFSRSDPY